MALIDSISLGSVVTTSDKERYKMYVFAEGRFLENMNNEKDKIDTREYNDFLNHTINPAKNIERVFNPRTQGTWIKPSVTV